MILLFLSLALLCTLLWRFQGGGLVDVDLPSSKVWYVIALLSGITWFLCEDVKATAIIAFGLLFVSFIPHEEHYTLNNQPTKEHLLEKIQALP